MVITYPQRSRRVRRPSLGLWLSEPSRSAADLAALLLASPWLATAPCGDGHPVLVLPGLMAGDSSTLMLRQYLRMRGYAVHGWSLGRNVGPSAAIVSGLPATLARLNERYGQPVSVLGWSLGGVYARDLARRSPARVRQIITLASPFAMTDLSQTYAVSIYKWSVRRRVPDRPEPRDPRTGVHPLRVPSTAIYSRHDGIVAWQTCREDPGPQVESIAVPGSHLGFGHNPWVLWVVADRLAQEAGSWRPFVPPRALQAMFAPDTPTRS